MAVNIAQLRRLVFRKWTGSAWEVFTLEPDDLGQDSILTYNIAPRKMSRASSLGTSETPIAGTLDSFSASVTFLMDNFKILGKALNQWTASTYEGADANAGQIIDSGELCAGDEYLSVVAQGVCDDGSAVDIEFSRCKPSVDDDIEIGGSDATEVTLALNPIIYNVTNHSSDGYPAYSYRMGDYSTTANMRLNAATGEYTAVNPSEGGE